MRLANLLHRSTNLRLLLRLVYVTCITCRELVNWLICCHIYCYNFNCLHCLKSSTSKPVNVNFRRLRDRRTAANNITCNKLNILNVCVRK
jgi:hypothetical protein